MGILDRLFKPTDFTDPLWLSSAEALVKPMRKAVRQMSDALSHPDPSRQANAMFGLQDLSRKWSWWVEYPDVLDPFLPGVVMHLREGRDDILRCEALEMIRSLAQHSVHHDRLRQHGAPEALVLCLSDPNRMTRAEAAESLGYIGDEASVMPLIGLLQDVDHDEYWEAAEYAAAALSQIRDSRALPALVDAVKHPSYLVRGSVARALGAFGGKRGVCRHGGRSL